MSLPVTAVVAAATPAAAAVWPDPAPVEPMTVGRAVKIRTSPVPVRVEPLSRAATTVRLEEKPPEVVDHRFATARLNVRTRPSDEARLLDTLGWAERVPVTGNTRGRWTEIVVGDEARWVRTAYLAESKPKPEPEPEPTPTPEPASATPEPTAAASPSTPAPAPSGFSSAACATGSEVESGLVANAVAVHRAVCAAFPEVTSYGGLRPGDPGEHGTGHALDVFASGATGDRIAEWARDNAGALDISQVIWSQHIWTVQRSSEGWRLMEDRGSTTANHYDHVHITVY